MSTIVVYWSGTGNTEDMANNIAESLGVTAKSVSDVSASEVLENDTIVLGCPAMGAEELEEGEFQPLYDELKANGKNKRYAFFGSYGWGGGEWMQNWQEDAKNAGLNLVCEGLISNGGFDSIEGDFDSFISAIKG
jgi:flavodoxin short chain